MQGIVLHGFIVKGVIELLAEDKKDNTEDDSDSETKEPETAEWVLSTYIDLKYSQPCRNFRFIHAYMHIMIFFSPYFEMYVNQLENSDSDNPLSAIFEILEEVNVFYSEIH